MEKDNGKTWKKFLCRFKSPDGVFAFDIHALSREHAQMLLEDLKQTATVDGEAIERTDGSSD